MLLLDTATVTIVASCPSSSSSYLDKLIEGNVKDQLLVGIALASQSRVSDKQIGHGKGSVFVARVAVFGINLFRQVHHLPVVRGLCRRRATSRRIRKHIHLDVGVVDAV